VSRRIVLTPEEALGFVAAFRPSLPDGWGFLVEVDDGVKSLVLTETEPPIKPGWMFWIARTKPLLGGRRLQGGVPFDLKDRPQDVEAVAWLILGDLRAYELRDAARWN